MEFIQTRLEDNKEYDFNVQEHKAKRSLDQNAYFHSLIDKYADWMGISKIYLKNDMIAHYGQTDKNKFMLIPAGNEPLLEEEHLRSTNNYIDGKDGQVYRYCIVMRGTHTYNTKEMSILIQGLIDDIKGSDAPIETMSEKEMRELWGAYA